MNDVKNRQPSRAKFRGFYIYGIDGDDLDLPASEEILKQGYRGYPMKNGKETHYPKMYTVQAVDLISGMIVDFAQSAVKQEVILAREIARNLEKNSIAIYDRLHGSYMTAKGHIDDGNYFVIRVKSKNPKNPVEILDFCKSKKQSKWIDLGPNRNMQKSDPSLPLLRVRLVKIKNPRAKEVLVLMTNLTEAQFKDKELGELYERRWGIESSFKDLTSTLKLGQ